MAHANTQYDEAALMARPTAELNRLGTRGLIFGVVGIIAVVIGYVMGPDRFWDSYLIGYMFWIGITVGSLGVLMVQHLSGGKWTMISRRVLEAATRNIPLMAILFLPIWFNLEKLYPWVNPDPANEELVHQVHLKHAYLNTAFFGVRAILFFAIWGGLAFLLNRWSRQQDEQPTRLPGPLDRRSRVLSGPGLVLFVATVTFMSVDWVMSLDPKWFSTIFGVLFIGGSGLSTMAFTIIVLALLVKFRPMSDVATADNFHDHGKLMFAFLMLWAYFSVSQFLIIWSANLPEEVPFYLARLQGPWYPASVTLLFGQFALPFLMLLSQKLKRNPRRVLLVALFILIMRVVDIAWTIGPVFRTGSGLSWLDFAMVVAIAGPWLFLFFFNLAGRAVVPAHDPYFKQAVADGGH